MHLKQLKTPYTTVFFLLFTLIAYPMLALEPELENSCMGNDSYELCTTCPASCDPDWCTGWRVGAEVLFWKPRISDMHYALVSTAVIGTSSSTSHYQYLTPEWDLGGRIFFQKEKMWNCSTLTLSYTFFKAEDQNNVTGTADFVSMSWAVPYDTSGSITGITEVSADWDFEYHVAEMSLSYELRDILCNSFKHWAYTGIRALIFNEERTDVESNGGNTFSHSREVDYWGFGTMVGMGFCYEACEGLEVFAAVDVSLLMGTVEWTDIGNVPTNGIDYRFESMDRCYCLPGWHISKGISYTHCLCTGVLTARAGLEVWQWHNAPSYLSYEHQQAGRVSSDERRTIAFSGFFAGLSYTY